MLGRLLRQSPPVADEILEGVWTRFPDRLEPLAAASKIAPRLPIARALQWSSRLRGRGLSSACPLVVIANDESLDPRVRLLAAAAAYGSFGDRRVVKSVHEARSLLDASALEASTQEIGRLAPGLLDAAPFVGVEVADDVPPRRRRQPRSSEVGVSRATRPTKTVASITARGGVNIVGPFEAVERVRTGRTTTRHVARPRRRSDLHDVVSRWWARGTGALDALRRRRPPFRDHAAGDGTRRPCGLRHGSRRRRLSRVAT